MKPLSAKVQIAARIVLGLIFLYLGIAKAQDPVGFLKLVRQFDLLSTPPGLNVVAATLPWFEVYCGILLLVGFKVRAAAAIQLVLLTAFTAAVLIRAMHLYRTGATSFCALRFDCGCGTGEVLACMKLAENTALMLLAAIVATNGKAPTSASGS